MASEFNFKFTAKAEDDLDGIVSYIAISLCNPQSAAAFLSKLQAAIDEACAFPESGSPVDNEFFPYKTVRRKPVGNYIMYYFPDTAGKTIIVLRVLYGRKNPEEILREISLS
jgi:toxin ParE1/3/4